MIKQTLAVLALTTTASFAASPPLDDYLKSLEEQRETAVEMRQDAWEVRDFNTVIWEQEIIDSLDKRIELAKPAPTKQINNNW